MERLTTTDIVDGIREGSKYMYYEGINYSGSNTETRVNREALEYNVMMNVITKADLFLVEIVHRLGFCTVESVQTYIRIGASRNAQESACIMKAGYTKDRRALRGRLEFLTRQGLLHCSEYMDAFSNNNYIYACSSEGFRAFYNGLVRGGVYNKNMVFKPPFEVFRYVSANFVMLPFACIGRCREISPNGKFFYPSEDGKKDAMFLYGKIAYERADGHIYYLIFEPAFFNVDESILSAEENEVRIKERCEGLKEMAGHMQKRGDSAGVVFIVENGRGLDRLIRILSGFDLSFFRENCFFTSENVVVKRFVQTGDPSDCLIGLYTDGGSARFKQKFLPLEI